MGESTQGKDEHLNTSVGYNSIGNRMDSGGAEKGELLYAGFRTNHRGTVKYVQEKDHIPGT